MNTKRFNTALQVLLKVFLAKIRIHQVAVSIAITTPRKFSVISPRCNYNVKLTICKERSFSFDTLKVFSAAMKKPTMG
jgi:hypothetical protein